jgi:hypothetical protein
MVDEYKDKVKRLALTETINSLLEIQGTDLSEFLDHNQISNLLIDCRDEIFRLTACLRNANENFEHFEREWYLANDRVEKLEKALREIADQCVQDIPHPVRTYLALDLARAALEGKDD